MLTSTQGAVGLFYSLLGVEINCYIAQPSGNINLGEVWNKYFDAQVGWLTFPLGVAGIKIDGAGEPAKSFAGLTGCSSTQIHCDLYWHGGGSKKLSRELQQIQNLG